MKQLLIAIVAIVLVGCGESHSELLLQAVIDGNVKEVKQHLASGADVNMKDDARGKTPLHFAAGNGQKEIVESLLAAGADVNAKILTGRKKGMTPLAIAKMFSNKKIIALLRKHGGKTGEELKAEGK